MGKLELDLLLARVDHLPTLPTVAMSVGRLVEDPASDSRIIADALKADQALSARVLALVNSAHYAIPGGVADVRRAVSYLGFNTVYQLVITVSVFDALGEVPGTDFDLKSLWRHSLGVAIVAEAAARQIGHASPEDMFSAGLLHDIGKVALAKIAQDKLGDVVRTAISSGISFRESELSHGLPSHDQLGRRLAERWRLPGTVVAGIGHHHRLDDAALALLPPNLRVVPDVVALGDVLCRRAEIGSGGDAITREVDPRVIERLNLSDATVQTIADELPRALERSKVFLEVLS
jgi:putative nucleotidyltransferase with HDIG domain